MKGKDDNSYKSILKGTSFFGGVHVFQILITLVRGKFVAMFLGPEGMGISSLFTASSNTLQRFASLGLNLAIVKEVAADSDDHDSIQTTIATARRLTTLTALAGALVCILFSSLLSRVTFGDDSMAWQFVLLGIVVGLTIAFNGKLSILQGVYEVKRISLASLVGGITGLAVGVPLYYFFGSKGIVPAMIALALSMYIFYSVNLRKAIRPSGIRFSWKSHKHIVKKLVTLGILLMANDLIASLVQYVLNVFINSLGSTDSVGLYQSANSITNQYAGMVFAAMAMDFFPRLTKAASDNALMRDMVNRQSEIVSIIIAPTTILLILTSPILIRIFLTSDFLPVSPLMRWMGLGIMFRALMVPMGYISFAKGNKKLFFWLEGIFCNALTLALSCVMYARFGLLGLGYAFVADNAICILVYYIINRRLYGYRFSRGALLHMSGAATLVIAAFMSSLIESTVLAYSMMTSVLIVALAWAAWSLRRKLRS
ncbi:MAG: O-antigen translocase [Muribaculaceae bacterium]|nr:O-antigen translocase [Muribaculaceae bacterium]